MNDDQFTGPRIVIALVVVTLILSGPVVGIDFSSDGPTLGEGNASIEIVQPADRPLSVTEGRFGTGVSYVRIPDLVVDVTSVEGNPRVFYQVRVPKLGIKKQNHRIIDGTGKLRVPISDRAIPRSTEIGNATAHLVVRVQSYSGGQIVLNRTVEVAAR
jgi:hypothetical protein